MKTKHKICDVCDRPKLIWKNYEGKRYCKQCWSCHPSNVKPKPTARGHRLPSRSAKRTHEEQEYSKLRKEFLSKRTMCEMRIPSICTQQATDVHHKAGRAGDRYLDTTTWLPGCRSCHIWVETHPKEARELGLSDSKL